MNTENTIRNADIALKAKLFVSGWQLSKDLQKIRNNKKSAFVDIYYVENNPVAVLVVEFSYGISTLYGEKFLPIQIFVKKQYRRNGIGTALIKKNTIEGCSFKLSQGIQGISDFFKVNNLQVWH